VVVTAGGSLGSADPQLPTSAVNVCPATAGTIPVLTWMAASSTTTMVPWTVVVTPVRTLLMVTVVGGGLPRCREGRGILRP
jgi:hypothetical protein